MSGSGNPRELPGFKKKSFAMAFGGGEIWFEHLDGIYGYEELVLEKLSSDRAIFRRPSMPSLICFNLDETVLTETILSAITDAVINDGKLFTRICFVGTDRTIAKRIKKQLCGHGFALWFTDDFEMAKKWLITEGNC